MALTHRTRIRIAIVTASACGVIGAAAFRATPPEPTLAVRGASGWATWWRREAAPARWDAEGPLAARVDWQPAASGMEWGQLHLRGPSEAWRTRIVVVQFDPRVMDLSLDPAFTRNQSWTISDVDSGAVLALDAGQFRHSLPWGWVVSEGKELLPPEYAPLAGAVVVDSSGGLRIVPPDSVDSERKRGNALEAFQSYPMLLQDAVVPRELRESGSGVDLTHRDARLALGTQHDGRVVIALTRFDALGESLGRLPFGLTTPEMAAVMGGLGCEQALLLDGGISSQLMLRTVEGFEHRWAGTRSVPLGLIGRAKRTH